MKYLPIVFLLMIAAAGVALVYYRIRSQDEPTGVPGGFRNWVKNPDYRRSVSERMAAMEEERESLTVPDDISDAEIQELVERLFEREDRNQLNYKRVELLGQKAHPFLVRALDDPRIDQPFAVGDERFKYWGPNFPLLRVAGLLNKLNNPLVARRLCPYVGHQDKEIRKYVASVLGKIASDDSTEAVVQALADSDDYVRSYAMMGIGRALSEGKPSPAFLEGIFPALVNLLDKRDKSVSGSAPSLLLRIDEQRALPILLSPQYFTIENRELHYIVEALGGAGRRIPRQRIPLDMLRSLLEELRPLCGEYPHSYSYAAALRAYALTPDDETEATLRRELNSANEKVQEAAAESLAVLAGIGNSSITVFEVQREHGYESLSKPQKQFYEVWMYDAEINNGGHSQYFVNYSGDNWPTALAGLRAIGATERTQILQEAIELFGRDGPPVDNEARHEQLAGFSERKDQTLRTLDDRYYASQENVVALLLLYAIDNPKAFPAK